MFLLSLELTLTRQLEIDKYKTQKKADCFRCKRGCAASATRVLSRWVLLRRRGNACSSKMQGGPIAR